MSISNGTILDATAIIDFHWLGEWDHLETHFGPLHVSAELLACYGLSDVERCSAVAHLAPLTLAGGAFRNIHHLRLEEPGLSLADRATLALAIERSLRCATDDRVLAGVCNKRGIMPVRTLAFLRTLVETGHRTPAQAIRLAHRLVREGGKSISPKVLRRWEASLELCAHPIDDETP